METQICPWCQTEIVWDKEIGPETECPHCSNELGDYRTMNIDLLADEEDDEELIGLEQDQQEGPECSYCGDTTVLVGEQTTDSTAFRSAGLLHPPFTTDVYLCVSCMQMQYVLSEKSRSRLKRDGDQ